MGFLKTASALLVLASAANAFPAFTNPWSSSSAAADVYVNHVVESLASPPRGWVKDDSRVIDKDDAAIRLRVHLARQDLEKFYEVALNIATPGHSQYGDHMSQHHIDAIIAPKDESGSMVMEWLDTMGLRSHASYSKRGDSIIIEASVAQIEKLLDAEYSIFCKSSCSIMIGLAIELIPLPQTMLKVARPLSARLNSLCPLF